MEAIEEMEEMEGTEETVVGAVESAEGVAMKARGIEALQITKGHGDDIVEQRIFRERLCNITASSTAKAFTLHFDTWAVSNKQSLAPQKRVCLCVLRNAREGGESLDVMNFGAR